MIRLNAGFSRKVGEPNYGSRGASVNVELELESNLIADPQALADRIQGLFAIARRAVDDELSSASANGNGPETMVRPNANPRIPNSSYVASGDNGQKPVRRATVSQVRAIRAICEQRNCPADRLANQRYGVGAVEELTLQQASALIDELKGTAAGTRNGGGR